MSDTEPYDLQRLYAEKTGGPFTFTWADRVWSLPSMRMLDISAQERIENLNSSDATVETINLMFDDLMGAEQGALWRQTTRPLPMIMDLFKAWVDHSRGAMGESEASDDSSPSTGRPSKRTSNGSTKSVSRRRSTVPKPNGTQPVSS